MAEEKTFRVTCAHCERPFHVRFALEQPDAEGEGEVIIDCLYCRKPVKIVIPRVYIEKDHLTRGLKSVSAG